MVDCSQFITVLSETRTVKDLSEEEGPYVVRPRILGRHALLSARRGWNDGLVFSADGGSGGASVSLALAASARHAASDISRASCAAAAATASDAAARKGASHAAAARDHARRGTAVGRSGTCVGHHRTHEHEVSFSINTYSVNTAVQRVASDLDHTGRSERFDGGGCGVSVSRATASSMIHLRSGHECRRLALDMRHQRPHPAQHTIKSCTGNLCFY